MVGGSFEEGYGTKDSRLKDYQLELDDNRYLPEGTLFKKESLSLSKIFGIS